MAHAREHLALANHSRRVGSTLRRQLRAGEVTMAEVLDHPDVQGHRLRIVLGWQKYYGPARNAEMLRAAGVGSSFLEWPLRRLTARQKQALAAYAAEHVGRRGGRG